MSRPGPIRHQLAHLDAKSRSKPFNRVQTHVGTPALDIRHMRPVQPGTLGKLILRPFTTLAKGFDSLAELLFGVHPRVVRENGESGPPVIHGAKETVGNFLHLHDYLPVRIILPLPNCGGSATKRKLPGSGWKRSRSRYPSGQLLGDMESNEQKPLPGVRYPIVPWQAVNRGNAENGHFTGDSSNEMNRPA